MGTQKWPGQTDKCHPEVFTIPPPAPAVRKPGQFTDQQVKDFFEKGYVLVEDFFDKDKELEPVKATVEVQVDNLAHKLYDAGKITKLYKTASLAERLTLMEAEFPGAWILLHKMGTMPTTFQELWSNERLLNLAEQLIGTADLSGHPVWNIRPKVPKNEATTVPWHQDSAYFDNRSYDIMQLTAWIPLLDATELNGCLQMATNGHRSGRVATHQCCHGGTWYVMLEEEEMKKTLGVDLDKDIVTVPVPFGGALFFNNMIPHRSLSNLSKEIRWSLDLRWQRADKPVGFYDLKNGVQLRSATDNNFKIDWDTFNTDRHKKVLAALKQPDEEFDTTVPGPWMQKWEIVHVNRHTMAQTTDGGTFYDGLTITG